MPILVLNAKFPLSLLNKYFTVEFSGHFKDRTFHTRGQIYPLLLSRDGYWVKTFNFTSNITVFVLLRVWCFELYNRMRRWSNQCGTGGIFGQ